MMRSAEAVGNEVAEQEAALTNVPCHVRLLTNQSPLGFNAGDTNLYRYVSNSPTNLIDPNGLQVVGPSVSPGVEPATLPPGLTEADARSILETEIVRWKGKEWNFAINLLRHFLGKKGPAPYILNEHDEKEVIILRATETGRIAK